MDALQTAVLRAKLAGRTPAKVHEPPKIVEVVESVESVDDLPVIEQVHESPREVPVVIHRQEPEPNGVVTYASVARIADVVGEKFSLSRADIMSHRRTKDVSRPRQMVMYLARTLTLRTLPEIGRYLGGRDHTTVLFAVRKIKRLRETDETIDTALKEFEERLKPRFQ